MVEFWKLAITVLCAVVASSGFWSYLQSRKEKKDVTREVLIGLGHDRIVYLGLLYIERGFITPEEYENLNEFLWRPYEKMGGNGTAKQVMAVVRTLPIKRREYRENEQ